MKSKNCDLKTELLEGLLQYERDTNLSPKSIIESLVEDFLYKKGYLVISDPNEFVPFPTELNRPHLKYTSKHGNNGYQIKKQVNGTHYKYGTCSYDEAKKLIEFLKSKEWNPKYSTKYSGFRGRKQINFLLSEMEKETNYD